MTRLAAVLALLAACLVAPAAAQAAGGLAVTVERDSLATPIGHSFVVQTTVENRGSTPAPGVIAHLNVLSLRPGVYVDPEDWSSSRTRYLGTIPAGGSQAVTWRLSAVNAGSFGVYVAALRAGERAQPPVAGPTVHVAVAERRTLDPGGVLPLAVGIPAALGLVALGVRRRRAHG